VSDNSNNDSFSLGQLVAAVGAFSAVTLFIAADSAFSFARGLMSSLGFPAQIMTFRTSLDFFPTMGIQYTYLFVGMFGLGFFIFKRGKASNKTVGRRIAGAAVILVILATIADFWPSARTVSSSLIFANTFAPLIVGYSLSRDLLLRLA
jgi:hypothetical protein